MKKISAFLLTVLFSVGVLTADAKPRLIGMKRAQAIATARARGLKLKGKELEKEKGKWIYSFEFQNKDGSIREVNVNARTGKIVGIEYEGAKKEKDEAKTEKKKNLPI